MVPSNFAVFNLPVLARRVRTRGNVNRASLRRIGVLLNRQPANGDVAGGALKGVAGHAYLYLVASGIVRQVESVAIVVHVPLASGCSVGIGLVAQRVIVEEHVLGKHTAWGVLLALPVTLASLGVDFCDPKSTLAGEVAQQHRSA